MVIGPDRARELFAAFPGLTLWDDPAQNRYPMPIVVEGQDDCYVGRVRQDLSAAQRDQLLGGGRPAAQGRRVERGPDRRAADPLKARLAHRAADARLRRHGLRGLAGSARLPDGARPPARCLRANPGRAGEADGGEPHRRGRPRPPPGREPLHRVRSRSRRLCTGPQRPPARRDPRARGIRGARRLRRQALGPGEALPLPDRPGPGAHPLLRRYAWHRRFSLDARRDAERAWSAPGQARLLRLLRRARPRAHAHLHGPLGPPRRRGDERLAICLSADSFLHHMVRNIVGSLVEVGRGARPPAWMADLLAGRDRTRAGPTARPRGSCSCGSCTGRAARRG